MASGLIEFLARRWRRFWLARRRLPGHWRPILQKRLPFYRTLPPHLQIVFHRKLKVFVWEKRFTGEGGLSVDDEIRVVIAGTAVRLILFLPLSYYDHIREIVVYPQPYKYPDDKQVRLGGTHPRGTVTLCWPAVLQGIARPHDGRDTAIHEFAHALDCADGRIDGTPILEASSDYQPWTGVLRHHFRKLAQGSPAQVEVLRRYGSTNEAEFFAVATEAFFEKPTQMNQNLPALYQQLVRFYNFDPRT